MSEKMPQDQELFKTPEEEQREKGPIFKFAKKERDEKGKEIKKEYASVAGIELEVNKEGEGTQFKEEEFQDFSLDKKSLELLESMAISVKLDQPLLQEGPTDIGKTKALEYLAYLTNNHLLYQSFSGQTDVSDLIGKYVPAIEDVRIRFENILSNRKNLSEDTKTILRNLDKDSKRFALTLDECLKIAQNEGLADPRELEKLQWNWADGELLRQMKYDRGRGCWSYFDELGAAEPQVLVKINRIFSQGTRRISVSENSENPTIEAIYPEWHSQAGKPNRFRIVATTNPPSYAGRIPFEKDFIRRWNYKRSAGLDEQTFLARLDWVGHQRKAELPEIKYHEKPEGYIDLDKNPEIDHLVNRVIAEFSIQAQKKLDSWEWGQGEQEFRFDEMSEAFRTQQYMRKLQGRDLVETLKDAIRYYYTGKIEANLRFYFKDVKNEKFEEQEDRVKELESLLEEIISGPTGPGIKQIDGSSLSIQEAIEKEVKKLNPEIAKKELEGELQKLDAEMRKSEFLKGDFREGAGK